MLCPPVSERFQRKSAVIFKASWKVWKPVVVFLLVIFKAAWKVAWIRVVVFLLPILLVGSVFFPDHLRTLIFVVRFGYLSPDLLWHWILIILGLCLYFLPSFMAYSRKHLNREAVLAANLLLGWTILGWVICLVWAVMRTQTKKQ